MRELLCEIVCVRVNEMSLLPEKDGSEIVSERVSSRDMDGVPLDFDFVSVVDTVRPDLDKVSSSESEMLGVAINVRVFEAVTSELGEKVCVKFRLLVTRSEMV